MNLTNEQVSQLSNYLNNQSDLPIFLQEMAQSLKTLLHTDMEEINSTITE